MGSATGVSSLRLLRLCSNSDENVVSSGKGLENSLFVRIHSFVPKISFQLSRLHRPAQILLQNR